MSWLRHQEVPDQTVSGDARFLREGLEEITLEDDRVPPEVTDRTSEEIDPHLRK